MIVIYINEYTVKTGQRDALIKELNESGAQDIFRSQPGCICFNFSAPVNEPDKFYLTDAWADEESFQAHTKCAGIPLWHALKDKYFVGESVNRAYNAEVRN